MLKYKKNNYKSTKTLDFGMTIQASTITFQSDKIM